MRMFHFYFSKNGWRDFGLIVCWIAIYLHMGIILGNPYFAVIMSFVTNVCKVSNGAIVCGSWATC